ncbi:Carboxylesterase [Heterobasidion irregulare TC 32-1]|uniref:Carboxylic ester hydrolase n=1 Tax=Heterobasidion irregulare (strain TC 32-1) TaxID=747525 RepID=W4K6F5_HETIT|nr:Carboxylesterase [Heterobasidion irregulare TC 32-1]ETW81383.1 Carboxylesterase [Heterobasidion irregulare TC 32-1]
MRSPCILRLLSLAGIVLASPSHLDIVLNTGTFRGVTTTNGTEKWLGIPYAQSPVGNLRFKAPLAIQQPFRTLQEASTFGDACPQPPSDDLGASMSEDCLVLNVYRPNGTSADAKLPVLVWLHGGFYMIGSSSNPSTDPTRIINRSVAIGKPIIFVSLNYRLNTFGFLASAHVDPEDLNAGLLDQRAAFEFIQTNIAPFGGDPSKVTIWGQSAGAGSVHAHVLYPSSQDLFRAAIMDSDTGPFKSSPNASVYDEPGKPFALLTAAVDCPADNTSFTCLQRVSFQTLLNASNTFVLGTLNDQFWEPAIGPAGSFATERESTKIERGDFLHIPLIAGTNLNEGSIFSETLIGLNLTGEAEDNALQRFVLDTLVDDSPVTTDLLDAIVALYPANDSSLGAPFNTGDSLFDRGSAWYGDNMFLSSRRRFSEAAAPLQPAFAYFFSEFIPGNSPFLGVSHASELALLFGPVPDAVELDFANTYLDFYLNFINDLNPGSAWPQFTLPSKQIMQLKRDNITAIPDDFNLERTNFLSNQTVLDEFQK